jgi:5-methylthioadenosine/S-adenosylhomocysteine deaminase
MSIGLGTDGASGTRLDLFEQMRLLKSAVQGRYGLEINDPLALPAIETLRMATAGGANAVRLGGEIGTLEVGKKADLILLDIDQPHISPTANLPQTIVMAAGPSDVKHVIVDGRQVFKNREFLEIDEAAIRREAAAALQRVSWRAGLALPSPYLGR